MGSHERSVVAMVVMAHRVGREMGRAVSPPAALLVGLLLLAWPGAARAAELVMVESRGCPWCVLFNREIGPAYPRTVEGLLAPLRRVDISQVGDLGVAFATPVTVTPTFVLVEGSREVGRIVGYPGADFFWPLLQEQLAKLPRRSPSTRPDTAEPTRFSPDGRADFSGADRSATRFRLQTVPSTVHCRIIGAWPERIVI